MRNFLTFVIVLAAFAASSQDQDSVVIAQGRIINASTKEPVTAKIFYQSLPYGNIVGSQHSDNYSFPLYENAKYSLVVEALGFQTAKYMIDPAESQGTFTLTRDIELVAGSAPDTHVAGHVMRLNNLIFELGKWKISPESYGELELVLSMMKENNKMVIQLEGHTDYQGDSKVNMKLSKNRVDAVKQYLEGKGIPGSRIKTKAFGGTQPISKDDTAEAHRLNRRVELRILSNK
jgi:outer membrane protein OmpA-like peptidoglycan-associated protein